MTDDVRMKLSRLRRKRAPQDEHEQRLTTAAMYARRLTETGSRCHLNDGTVRFCHWQATELPLSGGGGEVDPATFVCVRCTIHPGGRYLDSAARLEPHDFA